MGSDNVVPLRTGIAVKPCPFCGAEADESDVQWTALSLLRHGTRGLLGSAR